VLLICARTESLLDVWRPAHVNDVINVGASNQIAHVLVAVAGYSLKLLEVVNGKLVMVTTREMPFEIACLNLNPSTVLFLFLFCVCVCLFYGFFYSSSCLYYSCFLSPLCQSSLILQSAILASPHSVQWACGLRFPSRSWRFRPSKVEGRVDAITFHFNKST
jgi:hypothetical protein